MRHFQRRQLLHDAFEEGISLLLTQDMAGGGGRLDPQVWGAGLGLRRAHLGPLLEEIPSAIQFMEVAPENWLGVGGRLGRAFAQLAERVPMVCHGLLLNLGGPDPIDVDFLRRLKPFLAQHRIRCYSDHLSFCGDRGLLYELLPIPFTDEAVRHVAARIRYPHDVFGDGKVMIFASTGRSTAAFSAQITQAFCIWQYSR